MKTLWNLIRDNRRANLLSFASIFVLTLVFAVTLGAGRGYHKIYRDVGGKGMLAVFEGNVACPYISLVPESYIDAVSKVPHVVDVAGEVRQRYAYGKNKNLTLTSTDPAKLRAFKDIQIPEDAFQAFRNTPNGALVGRKIFKMFGWKVGSEVKTAGLVFTVAGVFDQPLSVYESMIFLHKDYLQEITAKKGYVTSLLVKTDLPGEADQAGVIREIEAIFKDHPSRIVCRSEDELWQGIKASQGNLGDIILILGIALGVLLVILHINNALLGLKRKRVVLDKLISRGMRARSIIAPACLETAAVSVLSGVLAGIAACLAALSHPYVGTDMFHPPIYVGGQVFGVVVLVSLISGGLAALAVLPGLRRLGSPGRDDNRISNRPTLLLTAGILCLCGMIVVFASARTLGITLKSRIMNQGTAGNMIVVDAGADTPMFSNLDPETYAFIRTVPGIARMDGEPMVTRCLELASLVYGHFTVVKGVDRMYDRMYDQSRLIKGRLPAARNEIMIGILLSDKVKRPLNVGDRIPFEGEQWTVVGLFEDRLTVMGSGIAARLEDVQAATNRDHISFVTLRSESREAMESIAGYVRKTYEALLMENPEVPGVIVESEVEYYRHESEAINPLVMFFNLVSALYLLVGALILYNIVDSVNGPGHDTIRLRTDCEDCGRTRMIAGGVRILVMGAAGGLLALAATPLIANISINFMMMTVFLEIPFHAVLTGTLVATALGLAAAFLAIRRTRTWRPGIQGLRQPVTGYTGTGAGG